MLDLSITVTVPKHNGLPNESIKLPAASDNSLDPAIYCNDNTKIQVKFYGSRLQQNKVTFTSKAIINFYIVYTEVKTWP